MRSRVRPGTGRSAGLVLRIYLGFTLVRQPLGMTHFVYIMASRPGGALFVGRTRDLRAHVEAHRSGLSRHTAKYKIRTLVWFEAHEAFDAALLRERRIKGWKRPWKDALITRVNPNWKDVTYSIP